jgi:hypothetical protein
MVQGRQASLSPAGRGEGEGGHVKEINAFALVKSISLDQKMIKESADL